MSNLPSHNLDDLMRSLNLRLLTAEQVQRIDELLAEVGEYGEVHLIMQKGELRYINKVESYKAWKSDDGHKK
ncbi:MAG: hypothetical protein HZC38_09520 [Chloroflexi bacterium]|nr:hypothetical protein [Chloroflexota bacterium]